MTAPMLPDWIKPGARYRWTGYLWHVRGIVDGMAVVRRYSREKQRWRYDVHDAFVFMPPSVVEQIKGMHK